MYNNDDLIFNVDEWCWLNMILIYGFDIFVDIWYWYDMMNVELWIHDLFDVDDVWIIFMNWNIENDMCWYLWIEIICYVMNMIEML